MRKFLIHISLLLFASGVFAQNNELTGGLLIHTRSGFIGGFNAKYMSKVNKQWMRGYAFEVANIRNPKEIRIPTPSSGTFILGKSNSLFSLRPQFLMERIVFAKHPDQGVKVSLLSGVGPSLGIVKPYFVEYINANDNIVKGQYTEDVDLNSIIGNAGWFRGFGSARFVPGGNLKLSLVFDYSTLKNVISSIETGLMYEQFSSKIQQNPFIEGESTFIMAFVSLNFGKKL